jgi:hypothetical protein
MHLTPVVSLLSATALALTLSACKTATNAPNGQLVPATAAVTPAGSKNETLDNLVVPQTFPTASATNRFSSNQTLDRISYSRYDGDGDGRPDVATTISVTRVYGADQPVGINENVRITRNPRDATFDVVITGQDQISASTRYQDPAHRQSAGTINNASVTNTFPDGSSFSVFTVPVSPNFEYYASGSREITATSNITNRYVLFFERPGTTTRYVTWAAYWQGVLTENVTFSDFVDPRTLETGSRLVGSYIADIQRTAAVYGLNTQAKDVPKTGSANYAGSLFANTISGTTLDTILGTQSSTVNFASNAMTFDLRGSFQASGTSFAASGTGRIERPDIPNSALNPTAAQPMSSFRGLVTGVTIGGTAYQFNSNASLPNTFQATTIEGGFYGPNAVELGGAFRIVGGAQDTRLDIMGAFTGKKN